MENLQAHELLGTIYCCKKFLSKDVENITFLFESTTPFGIEQINDYNLIPINSVNTYSYLNNVKNLLESVNAQDFEVINNEEINNFFIVLNSEIEKLSKINDFDKFDLLNDIVKKTKLFARSPINVYGMNIFDIDKVINPNMFPTIKQIVFNKSDKQFIILNNDNILLYDIKSATFGPYNELKLEHHDVIPSNIKLDNNNFIKIIGQYITNNCLVIYTNNEDKKFIDNMYGDNKMIDTINKRIAEHNNKNSVIKR